MTTGICVLTHKRDPERQRHAAAGMLICRGCAKKVESELADLPIMWAGLLHRHLGSGAGGPFITGTPEKRIPYRDPVGDERQLIRLLLTAWAEQLAGDHQIGRPRSHEPADVGRFLTGHLDLVLKAAWVDQFAAQLMDRHGHAFGLLYPLGRRRFQITAPNGRPAHCIETVDIVDGDQLRSERCSGTLWANINDRDDLLPSKIWCDTCDMEVPALRWVGWGEKLRESTVA